MIPNDYIQKTYAGFLGMNAGIRLGAPVEPTEWTPEMIHDVYGDLDGYIKDYNVFSADDDANGPIFLLRALIDDAVDREMEPQDVARAWLNYTREGIGMIWWGGDGISTEHTVYLNLLRGMRAPESGSVETNGLLMAEQIGGQIFIDSFGWLFPNQPDKAAEYAEKAASVTHDKNGLYGARFIAACIAAAYSAKDVDEIIRHGLKEIPSDSTYAEVVHAVLAFYKEHPHDFLKCRHYLEQEWGYDKFTGVCHIIPNAGVCVLALLYGQGNLSKTIEIATACGWDTDCNAGNVGSIIGTFAGMTGVEAKYRDPINDFLVTSSVSGYLNILDIPTFIKSVVLLGYRVAGSTPPEELVKSYKEQDVYLDFTLPGATHGFKTDDPYKLNLKSNDVLGYQSPGSLEIFIDRMVEGEKSRVYYPTFFRRESFNNEKYKPVFSPKAYSGQTVSMKLYLEQYRGNEIIVTPYIRNTFTKEVTELESIQLNNEEWQTLSFVIPDTQGSFADEVGFAVESPSPKDFRAFGKIFLDEFHIYGDANYTIDFAKQAVEFNSVTPFAHHRGEWKLHKEKMTVKSDVDCAAFTGHYYMKDGIIKAKLKPLAGTDHALIFHALGTQKYYQAGFVGQGKVALQCNDFGLQTLHTVDYEWNYNVSYTFEVEVRENQIYFSINDTRVLEFKKESTSHGMLGLALAKGGECEFEKIEVNY